MGLDDGRLLLGVCEQRGTTKPIRRVARRALYERSIPNSAAGDQPSEGREGLLSTAPAEVASFS